MFPFAPSAWSLALELWFSVAFGVFLFRWRTSTLLVLVCIAFIALCHQARAFNTVDLGWSLNNLSGGAARFWFSFTLGVVLKRVSINRTLPVAVPRASLAIVFLFIFVPHNNPFIQLASVALLFPTFLLIATNSEPGGLLASISDHLGRLSYAIYILHAPVILLVLGSAKVLLPGFAHANPISTGTTILLLVLALSAILTYGFDEPVRKGILKLRSTSNRHQVTAKA
jgi:peptidoglycan/LPS O-acetylase OafA/YrhL